MTRLHTDHTSSPAHQCYICGGAHPYDHSPEDCPEMDKWDSDNSDPKLRRSAFSAVFVLAFLSWLLIALILNPSVLNAIDAWKAPWQ